VTADLLHPQPMPGASVADDDAVDPELLALPAPPRTQRRITLALLAMVAVTGAAMAYSLRGEAAYALAPAADIDLGDLYAFNASDSSTAGAGAVVEPNRFVSAHGSLGGALAVRFERPFESDTYRVAPVMGRRDLWVEVRVPSGEEGKRYVPPTSFRGRLVRWSGSGIRHRGLERAVDSLTHEAVPEGGWLLVDGESPAGARGALALAALFLGFAVWSVVTASRLVRRVE
jgi:hypothetical protein